MGKCKTEAIQTGFGTFRHNQAYPGMIPAYLEPCVTLAYLQPWCNQNPDIFRIRSMFRTPVYSQPWYIQNPGILRTLTYSKSEVYLQLCQTSTSAKIVNSYIIIFAV